jgi:hypothetical protein
VADHGHEFRPAIGNRKRPRCGYGGAILLVRCDRLVGPPRRQVDSGVVHSASARRGSTIRAWPRPSMSSIGCRKGLALLRGAHRRPLCRCPSCRHRSCGRGCSTHERGRDPTSCAAPERADRSPLPASNLRPALTSPPGPQRLVRAVRSAPPPASGRERPTDI